MFLEQKGNKIQKKGWIEVVCGSMFSGKTEELIRRLKRAEFAKQKVEIFKPAIDIRYDDENVVSHVGTSIRSTPVPSSGNILLLANDVDVIGIDEAQFFDDLVDFVLAIENLNKIVIIAGLDGDSDRKPFGKILECIPLCDSVVKLTALDMVKKDGTPAVFSKRISKNNDRVLIGNDDSYVAVSRSSYLT